MTPIRLYLNWPPSVNTYYIQSKATLRGKLSPRIISGAGRSFRESVIESVNEQVPLITTDPIAEQISVTCVLHAPDRRRRDLDNYHKPLLDALTHAGLWTDDVIVDQLLTYRGDVVKGGLVRIEITEAGPIVPIDYWP